jgi:hypothetical protein
MPEDDDMELDQLLARGRLSGSQYDEIERRVLAHVAPRSRPRPRIAMLLAAAVACALVIGLVLAGRTPNEPSSKDSRVAVRDDGFTARGNPAANGSARRAGVVLDVGCAGRPAHVCRIGDTLMFSVNNNQTDGFLLAFAERVGGAPGRIWYFPAAGGSAPSVEASASTTVLSQGVRLGPPHAVGQYRVMAWLSAKPADEARALAQSDSIAAIPIALEIIE